jgi:antitoxin (DNA-binding transcriptional repressor) of toxin-antitoxin stability system
MAEIAISKFKATCLAALEEVRRTREPLLVTRFGKPVAQIVPPGPAKSTKRKLGGLAKTIELTGDIVSPPEERP